MKRILVAAAAAALLVLPASGARGVVPERVTLLVMFDQSVSASARSLVHGAAGGIVTGRIPEVNVERVSVAARGAAVYENAPGVRAVQEPPTYRVLGRPNDPLINKQWALERLSAFRAWGIEDGKKKDVSVAVLDTGVDSTHVDLEKRVVAGYDYLELDDDAYDDHGHGTHVAGIVAANVNNHTGVAGLAPRASIIPMKVCASSGGCNGFAVLLGAVDSVQRGADVINMSLGGAGECTEVEQAVFEWIRDQGTLTVVAAGNSAEDGNPSIAPANCDFTLGVGATDERDRRAVFSSYGDWVDIAAPGEDIWSTLPPLVSIMSEYIGYGAGSGTSMACPYVAAGAALVKARHSDWSPEQIEQRLIKTAIDLGSRGRDDRFGAGLLNPLGALR